MMKKAKTDTFWQDKCPLTPFKEKIIKNLKSGNVLGSKIGNMSKSKNTMNQSAPLIIASDRSGAYARSVQKSMDEENFTV